MSRADEGYHSQRVNRLQLWIAEKYADWNCPKRISSQSSSNTMTFILIGDNIIEKGGIPMRKSYSFFDAGAKYAKKTLGVLSCKLLIASL